VIGLSVALAVSAKTCGESPQANHSRSLKLAKDWPGTANATKSTHFREEPMKWLLDARKVAQVSPKLRAGFNDIRCFNHQCCNSLEPCGSLARSFGEAGATFREHKSRKTFSDRVLFRIKICTILIHLTCKRFNNRLIQPDQS